MEMKKVIDVLIRILLITRANMHKYHHLNFRICRQLCGLIPDCMVTIFEWLFAFYPNNHYRVMPALTYGKLCAGASDVDSLTMATKFFTRAITDGNVSFGKDHPFLIEARRLLEASLAKIKSQMA
jgi:hypothetical protein